MRIAVCDDDEQELERLSGLIAEYQISRGISCECRFFRNSTDFLCDIRGGEYDLVFLDILMPGVNGMEAAQELRQLDKNVKLVFVSSSPQFAVESYQVGAYHYLLKPAEADALFALLDRVRNGIFVEEEQGIVLKNREGVTWVSFTGLEYVEVINKTVFFHLADGGIYEVTATLGDFEGKLLSRPEFLKVHRSYLINLSHVQSIGNGCVMTRSGHSIPVSRNRRAQTRDAWMQYLSRTENARGIASLREEGTTEMAGRSDGLWRILLVDDDPADRMFWTDVLRSHGCVVETAASGRSALTLAADESFDCVLLDVMIPGEDGFSTCEKLCRLIHAPVIFLSCLTEPDRQLEGFAAGGIDYITKDTPAELFWAKVETRIRLAASAHTQFCYGPMLLDLTGRRVLIEEKEVPLTTAEFDILWCLSRQPGHIFSPEELFSRVWGELPWDGGQTVQVHVSRLRRKLEKAWEEFHFIETVWGQGYRFVVPEFS